MRFPTVKSVFIVAAFLAVAAGSASAAWTTFYTHAQDPATEFPDIFSIRGLALAQNGSGDVYYGHIQLCKDGAGGLPDGFTNIARLSAGGALLSTRSLSSDFPPSEQPKTLATDDRGDVYTAFADGTVHIYNADLSSELASFSANPTRVEGVAVQHSGAFYYLYTSSRNDGLIKKYDVTSVASPSLVTSRDLSGTNARGLAVDSSGNVYVADKNGTVFKIASDFASDTSTSVGDVSSAIDVAIDGPFAFVSRQDAGSSAITKLLLSDLSVQDVLTDPVYSGSDTGLAGIDIDPTGRIYVADEDAFRDDGTATYIDRIYTVPEPGGILLGAGGLVLTLLRRRRSNGGPA
jgi:WD40 repeat protein